jgi:Rps23 Pro-64 3,4-dihydroxylase Tpa1-like proline 4-hydroxylase
MIKGMDIKQYIRIYDLKFPETFLEGLIKTYDDQMEIAMVGDIATFDIQQRNCLTKKIYEPNHINIIYNEVDKMILDYTCVFPHVSISKNDEGYIFLRYDEGCFYKEHIDCCKFERKLSIIIVLNSDFQGGQISFFNQSYTLNLRRNQAVVFPSNFVFPHQVRPVTFGTRRSIVTWVR